MCASNKGNLSPHQAGIKMLLANTCNAYNATPAYFDRQRPYMLKTMLSQNQEERPTNQSPFSPCT